jgi:hypothetical protein
MSWVEDYNWDPRSGAEKARCNDCGATVALVAFKNGQDWLVCGICFSRRPFYPHRPSVFSNRPPVDTKPIILALKAYEESIT